MAKFTYSRNGSETTQSIENATPLVKAIWLQAHSFGANIVRVRANETRYGNETGRTFNSFHNGKVSVYRQKDNPNRQDALYFARRVPLTKVNKGMQILEIASNVDVQNTLETIDAIQYYSETSFFGRLWNRIRYGTPMSIKS